MLRSIEDANAVFERARVRADRDGAARVGPLHVLWACFRSVPAVRLLRALGVEPTGVDSAVVRLLAELPRAADGQRAEVDAVLLAIGDRAVAEAVSLGHASLDGRHLLLGLFADGAAEARAVLAGTCWVEAEQLREGMRERREREPATAAA